MLQDAFVLWKASWEEQEREKLERLVDDTDTYISAWREWEMLSHCVSPSIYTHVTL